MSEQTITTLDELRELIDAADPERLDSVFWSLPIEERAWLIDRLDENHRKKLMAILPPEDAAALLEEFAPEQARPLLECIPLEQAAGIIDEMHSDARADLLSGMPARSCDTILKLMPKEEAEEVRELLAYAPDTAGGLMITEYLYYGDHQTVGEILDDLRANGEEYADYDIQYAYIIDKQEKLVGVLRMRDLLFSQKGRRAGDVMIKNPISVLDDRNLEFLKRFFDDHPFFGVPVVDSDGILCGVLRRAAVQEAAANRANSIFLKFSGIIGGEELRSMSLTTRFSRRLSFLSLNIFLNILAASVIAMNMDILDQVIALAVFMPIISDMSGCSGNQAVAVSIRELALGLVKPKDYMRVFGKELAVGLINGLALGLLLGFIAFLWKGNAWLGLVAGVALALNTVVAVCFGGLIPLILKGLRFDPALVSGPMLTTVTDMCGFFMVLSISAMLLQYLV